MMMIAAIVTLSLTSCKKINDEPIKPHEYVKAISVQVDAIDNDIISNNKTTPMLKSGDYNSTSRAWYLYKNVDGVLSLVDGTEF